MANAYYHAVSTAKRWGGEPTDYTHIHEYLDETKNYVGNFRHRALRHHGLGIQEAVDKFGLVVTNSNGRAVPVRSICEQHMIEDFGYIPTVQDWLQCIEPQPWMVRGARKLSQEVEA